MIGVLIVILLAAILVTLLGAWPPVLAFLQALGWMYIFLALLLFLPATIGVAFKLRQEARARAAEAKRAEIAARLEQATRPSPKEPSL